MVCVVPVEENSHGNIFSTLLLYHKQYMFFMPGRDPEGFKTLVCNIMVKDSV